jgi:hypothetical protein
VVIAEKYFLAKTQSLIFHHLPGLDIELIEALARVLEIKPLQKQPLFFKSVQGVSDGSCRKICPVYDILLG